MRAPFLSALLVGLLAACGPRVPTPSEARAAFAERRDRVATFEDTIFHQIATSGEPDKAQMEALVVAVGALGFEGATLLPSVPPCVGGTGTGEITPEQGFTEDKYAVGYGLYQTAWDDGTAHGDGEFHPGIVVRWRLGDADGPLRDPVTLCMLIDGTPRPK